MVMQTNAGGNDEPLKQTDDPAITHTATMEVHQAATIFPMMTAEEYEGLKQDIKEHGQREHIVVWKGLLVDGRNRLRACSELGIEPEVRELMDETEPVGYVLSQNLHRRHLTTSQRATAAAKLATLQHGDVKSQKSDGHKCPSSVDDAAKALNVSPMSVKNAKQVQQRGSKATQQAVEQGELPVSLAAKLVKQVPDKKEQARIVAKGVEAVRAAVKPKADDPPAAPNTASDWKMQRAKAKKTAEALQRALSDLNDLKRIQQLPDALLCVRAIISQLNDMNGDPPARPNTSTASIVLDPLDREIPQQFRAAHELSITLMSVGRELDKYRQKAKEFSEQPGGVWLQMQDIDSEVRSLKARFQDAIYHTVCPQCAGKGCQKCQQNGWLPDFMKGMIN